MIYICGDSFAVPDPEMGKCWVDYIAGKCPVMNLAQICASNLMIAQQVDCAVEHSAEFIIVLFTASTRLQTKVGNKTVPFSIHSLDGTTPFDQRQLEILKQYTAEFFDLDLAIYQNQLTIESVLRKLVDSEIPFVFDQGGFEHPEYGAVKKYFEKYNKYRSAWNLWDHAQQRRYRPYYHITDDTVHQQVAEYYYEQYELQKNMG